MKNAEAPSMDMLKERIREIIKENFTVSESGSVEVEIDYADDIFSDRDLYEMMEEGIADGFFNIFIYNLCEYSDNFCDIFKILIHPVVEKLSKEEQEFYQSNKEEMDDWIQENYYLDFTEENVNKDVKVSIMLDTANFGKKSSVFWLAEQQGKEDLLKQAITAAEKREPQNTADAFVDSVIQELSHTSEQESTLTFLVKMKLFDYFRLRVALDEESSLSFYDNDEEKKEKTYIVLDKSVTCGLFNSTKGENSLFGIKLSKDVTIPLRYICEVERDTEKSKHGHAASNVYRLNANVWKDGLVKMVFRKKEISEYITSQDNILIETATAILEIDTSDCKDWFELEEIGKFNLEELKERYPEAAEEILRLEKEDAGDYDGELIWVYEGTITTVSTKGTEDVIVFAPDLWQ